jgi:hypothetical protein
MAQMAQTAGLGGSQSTITTPGLALQDPNEMMQFAYAMAQRRHQQQQQEQPRMAPVAREPVQSAPRLGGGDGGGSSMGPALEPDRVSGIDRDVEYMAKRRKIMEDEAATRPAPMRMINGGPGISQGYTMDVNAMSADQRKMFLPQNSQMSPAIDNPSGGGRGGGNPLNDPYSDASRAMVNRGTSPAPPAPRADINNPALGMGGGRGF